jgi:hypothetical protein
MGPSALLPHLLPVVDFEAKSGLAEATVRSHELVNLFLDAVRDVGRVDSTDPGHEEVAEERCRLRLELHHLLDGETVDIGDPARSPQEELRQFTKRDTLDATHPLRAVAVVLAVVGVEAVWWDDLLRCTALLRLHFLALPCQPAGAALRLEGQLQRCVQDLMAQDLADAGGKDGKGGKGRRALLFAVAVLDAVHSFHCGRAAQGLDAYHALLFSRLVASLRPLVASFAYTPAVSSTAESTRLLSGPLDTACVALLHWLSTPRNARQSRVN